MKAPTWAGLGLLSAAALLYEVNLTRLYSVSQFYHFAFMIISLAMLGYGAGGTVLALFPDLGRRSQDVTLGLISAIFAGTAIGAYALMNLIPFDSFALVIDHRQIGILAAHYIALSLPFFCNGLALGLLFGWATARVGAVYASNLGGSALGCVLALLAPPFIGGEGVVFLAAALAAVAAALFGYRKRLLLWLSISVVIGTTLLVLQVPPPLRLRLSHYKGLSYALQFPGAQILTQRWNGYSRVDLVASPGIRSLPGLSYRYEGPVEAQRGVFVDADDLSPVLLTERSLPATAYMPNALAFRLAPAAEALVLQPRGGLDIWVALSQGANRVTAVEPNDLVVALAGSAYSDPRVTTVVEHPRSYLRRHSSQFDVLVLSLTTGYHPVRSGAYSLGEDYTLTAEAFTEYLAALKPNGYLVFTRWLQWPPSESLRAYALAVEAVERAGGDPRAQIVALRGYSTMTFVVKREPFRAEELSETRTFCEERAFDLVCAPDLRPEEVNRFNILPEPVYSEAFRDLLTSQERGSFYAQYPFDVRPPTDDHPFFAHYFRWSQMGQLLQELGSTWEPFGGAGYLALLLFGVVALVAGGVLVLLPVAIQGRRTNRRGPAERATRGLAWRTPIYFGLLGLAYLFVEIPLIQRFVLYLGQPTYSLTAVLFGLLLFSGVGSLVSARLRPRQVLLPLVILIVIYQFALPTMFSRTLQLPLAMRLLCTVLAVAPLGIAMGMPFPSGLGCVREQAPELVAWAWAANGAASVVASVGAMILALSAGFHWVLGAGALCYLAAWLAAPQGMSVGVGRSSSVPGPVRGTKLTPPKL